MFEGNILAGAQGTQAAASALNSLANASQTFSQTRDSEAKLAEWKSPEQTDMRKAQAGAAKESAIFQQKAEKAKNDAIDMDPNLASQIYHSGMLVEVQKNLDQIDDSQLSDSLEYFGDWKGDPKDYEDRYKAAFKYHPDAIKNLPTPQQMAEDPSQATKFKLYMATGFSSLAQRRAQMAEQMKNQSKLAVEQVKGQYGLEKQGMHEDAANTRSNQSAAVSTANTQAKIESDQKIAGIKTQSSLDSIDKTHQYKLQEIDKQNEGKIKAAQARASAGGKQGSPLKFNTDSGLGNAKQAQQNLAGPYIQGRLEDLGLDKKLAPEISSEVVNTASQIWAAENNVYAAQLKAGNPDATPPRNGRIILKEQADLALTRIDPRFGRRDKYTPAEGTSKPEAAVSETEKQAHTAFGAYEPDKFDYRINPQTGKIQRRAK